MLRELRTVAQVEKCTTRRSYMKNSNLCNKVVTLRLDHVIYDQPGGHNIDSPIEVYTFPPDSESILHNIDTPISDLSILQYDYDPDNNDDPDSSDGSSDVPSVSSFVSDVPSVASYVSDDSGETSELDYIPDD